MLLQEKLDAVSASLAKQTPGEFLDAFHRLVENLRASGLMDGVLKIGDPAPQFTLPSYEGHAVSLAALRARGPVIISFYRGRW